MMGFGKICIMVVFNILKSCPKTKIKGCNISYAKHGQIKGFCDKKGGEATFPHCAYRCSNGKWVKISECK